jgi:TorA maturation chaperone TorD
MAVVAGFYRAFGVAPSSRRPERPDHIALELEFMALVLMKKRLAAGRGPEAEQVRCCADAEAAFFRDHLAWWVPSFAAGMRQKAGGGFYAAVAEALAALMPAERARLRVAAPRMPLRSSGDLADDEAECAGCSA